MKTSILPLTLAAMLASLGGCMQKAALQSQELVFADAQSTLTSATNALNDYAITKGIAQVAETGLTLAGQPALSAVIGSLIAVTDAQADKLQAAIDASTLDLAKIQTLVAQINAQVQALRSKAAPSITVIPTPTPTPASASPGLPAG